MHLLTCISDLIGGKESTFCFVCFVFWYKLQAAYLELCSVDEYFTPGILFLVWFMGMRVFNRSSVSCPGQNSRSF